jgi:hypothetical protein
VSTTPEIAVVEHAFQSPLMARLFPITDDTPGSFMATINGRGRWSVGHTRAIAREIVTRWANDARGAVQIDVHLGQWDGPLGARVLTVTRG